MYYKSACGSDFFLRTLPPASIRMLLRLLPLLALALNALAIPTTDKLEERADPTCTNPTVRKEWRSFTDQQKQDWIGGIKCLGSLPHDPSLFSVLPPPGQPFLNKSSTFYDDLVYLHIDVYPIIHFVGIFLPWHRWFLDLFEKNMRGKCGYTGPMGYWDWSLDADNITGSSIFDPNPVTGLGSFGPKSNGYHLTDGAFSDFILAYPKPHTLTRNFSDTPFALGRLQPTPWIVDKPNTSAKTVITPERVHNLVTGHTGDFVKFYTNLDSAEGFHTTPHVMVGGDMADAAQSANDPLFWLHHGQLDRLWWMWQNNHPSNKDAFGGGTIPGVLTKLTFDLFPAGMPPGAHKWTPLPNDNFGENKKVRDLMDTEGGFLCYTYE